MTITHDTLTARLAVLTNERQALLNNVNAYNGAIQQIEWLLEQVDAVDTHSNGLSIARMQEASVLPEG